MQMGTLTSNNSRLSDIVSCEKNATYQKTLILYRHIKLDKCLLVSTCASAYVSALLYVS